MYIEEWLIIVESNSKNKMKIIIDNNLLKLSQILEEFQNP